MILSSLPPDCFGDYKSFLEIGFALNALFGAWHAIPEALSKKRRAARRTSISKYAEEVSAEAYDRVDRISLRIVCLGRVFGVLAALGIATALFLIPDDVVVNGAGAVAIAGICMPVPAAIAGTFLVDWGFVAYLTVRKWREWIRYWWFVLSKLRQVGKADAIREMWRKRRDEERDDSDDD